MDRSYASGASGTPPSAPASPSIGYPTKGNAGTGTPATKPGEYWYHMITEEMRAVIAAAGLTPSQSDLTQLLQALPGALASRPEMAKSLSDSGYQKLPSGLIVQWTAAEFPANGQLWVVWPIAFPNALIHASGHVVVSSNSVDPNDVNIIGWDQSQSNLVGSRFVSFSHSGLPSGGGERFLAIGY